MSVLIEGISVVVKKITLEEKYRGGLEQYIEDCPNSMFCADEHLTTVAFQIEDDAFRWIRCLELQGLVFIQKGVFEEIALVEKYRGPYRKCEWLKFQRIRAHTFNFIVDTKIAICRLKGTQFGDLAFFPDWNLEDSLRMRVRYIPLEEASERLEFIGHKDDVDTLLDKKTGEKINIGRPFGGGYELSMSYDFFEKGVELVEPYLFYMLSNSTLEDPNNEDGRKNIRQGIQYLKKAVCLHPHNWNAFWYLGKAFQVLKDYRRAYKHFKTSYNLKPEDPSVCGTFMETCWKLNKTKEALSVAQTALRLWPRDPKWISDYGWALLADGQIKKAKKILKKALQIDSNDEYTKTGLKIIAKRESG
jgi:hypothetical protein